MVSDAAKKKALAKKLKTTAKLQGKDVADAMAASMSTSAVRAQHVMYQIPLHMTPERQPQQLYPNCT